jgi:hypothetical protein
MYVILLARIAISTVGATAIKYWPARLKFSKILNKMRRLSILRLLNKILTVKARDMKKTIR